MAAELSMNGKKKIETLQKEFTQKFAYLTLVFLDKERRAIDISKSLSEVRQAKGDDISIIASLKVNTLEKRFLENFGLIVEVAYQKSDKVVYTKDNVDKTLNELNKWCEQNDCQPFEFKKSFTGNTLSSVQEQLFEAIKENYPNAEAKKINKDNYLDVYVPEINKKRGTHLYFNTAKDGIKIGFYCRDEEFVEAVLSRSTNIEKYAQGIRILDNPLQNDVEEATASALSFLEEITGDQKNNSDEEDERDFDKILRDLGYGDDEDSDEDIISLKVGDKVDASMFLKTANVDFWLGDYKEKFIKEIFYSDDNEKYLAVITDNKGNVIDNWDIEALNTQFNSSYKISIKEEVNESSEDEIDEETNEEDRSVDDIMKDLGYDDEDETEDLEQINDEQATADFSLSSFDVNEKSVIDKISDEIKSGKYLTNLLYINNKLDELGYAIDKHQAYFFDSNVIISDRELEGFLVVNMDGFYSNCMDAEEMTPIFSWSGVNNIKYAESKKGCSIDIISDQGALTIKKADSHSLKILYTFYQNVWKAINDKFKDEPYINWGEVEDMGINEVGFSIFLDYYNFNISQIEGDL